MTGPTVTRPAHLHRQAKGRKRLRDKAEEPLVVHGEQVPREVQLLALAVTFEDMIRTGEARSYAEIARRTGVSRARISQIVRRMEMERGSLQILLLGAHPTSQPP